MKYSLFPLTFLALFSAMKSGFSEDMATLPECAQTGSASVFINGKPALKLSDVTSCPPELVEIIPDVFIQGQPMVRLRSGKAEKSTCLAKGSVDVTVSGQPAQRSGDASCVDGD